MTRAEFIAQYGAEPHDRNYWGPGGVDLSRWGYECQRGLCYKDHGTEIAGKANRRTYSGGRKARGMASDGVE